MLEWGDLTPLFSFEIDELEELAICEFNRRQKHWIYKACHARVPGNPERSCIRFSNHAGPCFCAASRPHSQHHYERVWWYK